MAGTTLDQLPPALALSGAELVWIYQVGGSPSVPWVGLRCTTLQLAQYVQSIEPTNATIRQLASAMAAEATLIGVLEALPSDITNSYNIAWNHANYIAITDSFITGFLQPTLGYSSTQMQNLYNYALTFSP